MNRSYEICPSFFAPKLNGDMLKIEQLRQLPMNRYSFPLSHIRKDAYDLQIRDFFRRDQWFFSASCFLTQALFCSNPIDALYNVHESLLRVHKGALVNRSIDSSAKDFASVLCFDDLFSLFFGALMAADLPDLSYLAWFTGKYAPKSCLSPSFEYALANVEALMTHCKNLDVESLMKLENAQIEQENKKLCV